MLAKITNELELRLFESLVQKSLLKAFDRAPSQERLQAFVADFQGENCYGDLIARIMPKTRGATGVRQFCSPCIQDNASVVRLHMDKWSIGHHDFTEATKGLSELFTESEWGNLSTKSKVMYLMQIGACDELASALANLSGESAGWIETHLPLRIDEETNDS